VKEAIRAAREEPTPDPRAKPTRVPPEHHYNPGRSWTGINSKQVSWELTSLDGEMDSWAQNYAGDDPGTAEARMTAEDKQAIIDYLGDWCLYKDWDSLVASLPPLAYDNRICLLVSATVLKNIFECVFRNPFFYIDLGEEWDGSGSDLPPPFGVELNRFFQKALKGLFSGLCCLSYTEDSILLRFTF
jgi:hypothetical protein